MGDHGWVYSGGSIKKSLVVFADTNPEKAKEVIRDRQNYEVKIIVAEYK